MLEDTFCSENDLPNNILLSFNGKRKRGIENCIGKLDIKNLDTGRGKRIKKPLNKYDHLDSLLDQEKINNIIKKRKGLKDDIQVKDDSFFRKPLSPNGLFPSIDLKLAPDNALLIDKIANNYSKINGKTYQELKVTDEDGKEEEIYVVDVTSDEEIYNYVDKVNNSFNSESEKSNILNGSFKNDELSKNLISPKDSKIDLFNNIYCSKNENTLNGCNNYNNLNYNELNNGNNLLNISQLSSNEDCKLNISTNVNDHFITENINEKRDKFLLKSNINNSNRALSYSSNKSSTKKKKVPTATLR